MSVIAHPWLTGADTQAVFDLLEDGEHIVFAVGGCVRDALLGRPVADVDMTTDAKPARVMALAEAAGMKAIPTGIDHGTVTLISGGQSYEVTTLRRDLETDGRHARVGFGASVAEDARRRDFTMNALYADRRGAVTDPVGGLPDLRAGRVRFVGDPVAAVAGAVASQGTGIGYTIPVKGGAGRAGRSGAFLRFSRGEDRRGHGQHAGSDHGGCNRRSAPLLPTVCPVHAGQGPVGPDV